MIQTLATGPVFFGVTSSPENISSILVDGVVPGAFSFEGIDNVAFNALHSVPEPASWVLVMAGVGAFATRRRAAALRDQRPG